MDKSAETQEQQPVLDLLKGEATVTAKLPEEKAQHKVNCSEFAWHICTHPSYQV